MASSKPEEISAELLEKYRSEAYPFNEEQNALLDRLKVKIQPDIEKFAPHETVTHDTMLMRFLIGNDFNLDTTATTYAGMLQWRENNSVDVMREELVKKSELGELTMHDLPLGEEISGLLNTNFHHKEDKVLVGIYKCLIGIIVF